jgi:hypothetical protein
MKLSERALKDLLHDIVDNEYRLPQGADALPRVLEMLPHMGTTDSELRDDLIYMTLAQWVAVQQVLDGDQLQMVWPILLDKDHLFYKIGEKESDSVFMRSFSMLNLALFVEVHNLKPYLHKDEVLKIKTAVLRYLAEEQDLRGYILQDDKGWAHGVAHTADCLSELALTSELEAADLIEILGGIRAKTAVSNTVFIHEEDERLVYPVIATLQRKLLREIDVKEWINGFVPLAQQIEPFPDCYYQAINVKNFLRSLHFRGRQSKTIDLIGENSATALVTLVDGVLKEIGRF